MKSNGASSRWSLQHLEVFLLAATLLATVLISAATFYQTKRHFEIGRTTDFVSRFNSQELVTLREDVDRWLETGESPALLYDRSERKTFDSTRSVSEVRSDIEQALKTVAKLRTMANFFQEFGTAIKIGSLNEDYAHELLGSVCIRYGKSLEPFIMETRKRRQRPQAYAEVFLLKQRMEEQDDQKK